jgi:hypothetical protein
MTVGSVSLDVGDAVELAELLEFVVRWLDTDRGLAGSLAAFVGHVGYDIDGLRADLARFAFLLGGDDGELLFGGGEG